MKFFENLIFTFDYLHKSFERSIFLFHLYVFLGMLNSESCPPSSIFLHLAMHVFLFLTAATSARAGIESLLHPVIPMI